MHGTTSIGFLDRRSYLTTARRTTHIVKNLMKIHIGIGPKFAGTFAMYSLGRRVPRLAVVWKGPVIAGVMEDRCAGHASAQTSARRTHRYARVSQLQKVRLLLSVGVVVKQQKSDFWGKLPFSQCSHGCPSLEGHNLCEERLRPGRHA